jgi:hypothetical protein
MSFWMAANFDELIYGYLFVFMNIFLVYASAKETGFGTPGSMFVRPGGTGWPQLIKAPLAEITLHRPARYALVRPA